MKLLLLLAGLQRDISPRMHTMFKWLCTMGKWSFLDALVVVLIVVIFRVEVASSVLGQKVYSGSKYYFSCYSLATRNCYGLFMVEIVYITNVSRLYLSSCCTRAWPSWTHISCFAVCWPIQKKSTCHSFRLAGRCCRRRIIPFHCCHLCLTDPWQDHCIQQSAKRRYSVRYS